MEHRIGWVPLGLATGFSFTKSGKSPTQRVGKLEMSRTDNRYIYRYTPDYVRYLTVETGEWQFGNSSFNAKAGDFYLNVPFT